MADALLCKIPTEIGAVMATITTGNGYSQTVPSAGICYDNIDMLSDELTDSEAFPRVEIICSNVRYADISQETHEAAVTVHIRAYIRLDDHHTDSLADQKVMYNFAADIRKALMSSYDRQAASSFVMPEFLLIQDIDQRFWTDAYQKDVLGIMTDAEFSFDVDYDTL